MSTPIKYILLMVLPIFCQCKDNSKAAATQPSIVNEHQSAEMLLMKAIIGGQESFKTDSLSEALRKQKQIYDMAVQLEKNNGFRELNANKEIGLAALNLHIFSEKLGDTSGAQAYKEIALDRLVRGGLIPGDYSPLDKEKMFLVEKDTMLRLRAKD